MTKSRIPHIATSPSIRPSHKCTIFQQAKAATPISAATIVRAVAGDSFAHLSQGNKAARPQRHALGHTARRSPDVMTSLPGVFAAGDIVRGASLVVWGIRDGRDVSDQMAKWLKAKAISEKKAA